MTPEEVVEALLACTSLQEARMVVEKARETDAGRRVIDAMYLAAAVLVK